MADKESNLDVLKKIQAFYQSNEYHALKALSNRKTMLDIFGKPRSETVHSAMLAWLFSNEEFQRLEESPVLFLLRLLAVNAESQKNEYLNDKITIEGRSRFFEDDNLWNEIVDNSIKVSVNIVRTEEKTKGKKNGRSDIAILCTRDNGNKLRICIENKIDTKEHDNQCLKYFDYYNTDTEYKTVYVYLSPSHPTKLSSNSFICITYQELLDNVLYPILNYREFYSEQSVFYLQEYIKTITSIKADNILAMSNDYKEILKNFYNNNSDIIYAAIEAVAEEDIKKKVEEIRKGTKLYKLTIENGPTENINGHSKFAYRIAEYLAGKMSKSELLKKYGKLNTKISARDFITDHIIKDSKGENRNRTYETPIPCIDKGEVYCSNQWVLDKIEDLIKKLRENKEKVTITY